MTDIASALVRNPSDLRRHLQQRYGDAQRLAASSKPDFRQIHNLLADCLRDDPGSVLYLDALIDNLRRRDAAATPSWWSKWFPPRRQFTDYTVTSTPHALLRAAPDLLGNNWQDPIMLRRLAEAAATCELDQVGLLYHQLALAVAPHDVENIRYVARTCTRQGRFDEALKYWQRLTQLFPEDPEALQALSDLGDSAQFDEPQQALANAQATGAPLLENLQKCEELQLARSTHRVEIARRRYASDPHPKTESLVRQLAAEHARLEIEIFHVRCERHPQDWQLRIELARRQKLIGNFSGAIPRLEEALQLRPAEPAVLIELGECWQYLRQFPTALDFYNKGIAAAEKSIENGNPESFDQLKLARYRTAVLAAASGSRDIARSHFTALLEIDPTFKDAQQRLDNLGTN